MSGDFQRMLDAEGKPLPHPVPVSWAQLYGFTPIGEVRGPDFDNCGECRET